VHPDLNSSTKQGAPSDHLGAPFMRAFTHEWGQIPSPRPVHNNLCPYFGPQPTGRSDWPPTGELKEAPLRRDVRSLGALPGEVLRVDWQWLVPRRSYMRTPSFKVLAVPVLCCLLSTTLPASAQTPASAQASPFLGDWRVPSGTIVRIDPCSSGFCMRIMFLSPTADATTDIHNPDATLRARSLCALEIGSRFHVSDATHASGGTIYDPKSGNTYRGQMVVEGDLLRLRGYVGFSLFGRTEIWHRVHQSFASCH